MLGQILTIVVSILTVTLAAFVVSRYQLWFIKHRFKLVILLIILGISIYSIGYLKRNPDEYLSSGLMAIFSTGRMFVFENDLSSFEFDVEKIPFYRDVFGLIMTFSMLTIGMVALSFFGYRVMCKIQFGFLKILVRNQTIYIFTSLNEKSLMLGTDIKKNHNKSLVIFCCENVHETDEVKTLEKEASQYGFLLLSIHHLDNAAVFKLCMQLLRNKIIIFAMQKNDSENAEFATEFATEFAETIKASKNSNYSISIYIFISNDEYEDYFDDDLFSGLNIQIVNENDLTARELFNHFTLISSRKDSCFLQICVIGYSVITEDLYKNITFLGQSFGLKLKIILIDEDIEDKTALFFNRNSEIFKCAEFQWIDAKLNSKKFFKYFDDHIQDINCIIFSDDYINTAIEISRLKWDKKIEIAICMYMKESRRHNLLFKSQYLKNVVLFGSMTEIFTEKIIINEDLDKLAKGFHSYYAKLYNDSRSWKEISLFEKQSNRALALHIQSKLFSIGLRYTINGDAQLFNERIKDRKILEELAIGEHLRWNAFCFANGWRTMANLTSKERNKDVINRTHSCLVDWDQLELVSYKFNKDFKKMDRHLVENIGNVLHSAGFGVEKIDATEK